ncbi:MAG: hypothetical protein IPJ17_10790 [Holophagales bacterium]|nr:MAG: hypothetical protein IPJ17_10790 [Holophagales bacterium]
MRMHSAFPLSTVLTASLALVQPAAAVPPATTVSPGSLTASVGAPSACPTFSWSAVAGAAGFELVVLDLSASEESRVVLAPRIAGAALSWTPDAGECLAPGRLYAWTVRALDSTGAPLDSSGDAQGWAPPRRFTVPSLPTASEVAAALATLRRWQEGQTAQYSLPPAEVLPTSPSLRERAAAAENSSAVRGENPATSGANHGLWGQTGSAAGAGVVAANLAGGADLRLDGGSASVTDAILTEKSLDRPSPSGESFSITNSGGGGMKLYVQGTEVSLTGHGHNGSDIISGTIAEARIAATVARDAEVMPIVLAADGPASGLDADTLDGHEAAGFQARVTEFCGRGEFISSIDANGGVTCSPSGGYTAQIVVDNPANAVGEGAALAIGLDGLPVISYRDSSATSLKVAKCLDPVCARRIVSTADNGGTVGYETSIAIGRDGFPVISHRNPGDGCLRITKCNDPACTGGDETSTNVDDFANDTGNSSSIAIGDDGFPVVSYLDATLDALKVAKCNDAACTTSTRTVVHDPVDQILGKTSLAIGNDGKPVISFLDWTAGTLKVAKCNDVACTGGGETISTVDDSAWVGSNSSIAIGLDGFPVISYFDDTNDDLKVAKCNDAACAGGNETITTVDGFSESVGWYTSIAIGTDGFPTVSYLNFEFNQVRLLKCSSASCAAPGRTISVVDSSTLVSCQTAIAIGRDGFPLVAYCDSAGNTLHLAKCNNATCK